MQKAQGYIARGAAMQLRPLLFDVFVISVRGKTGAQEKAADISNKIVVGVCIGQNGDGHPRTAA